MGRRPKSSKSAADELTPLELAIMRVIWERGDATAAEILAELKNRGRDLADTTVHTVLSNLRKRGAIEPIPTVERAFRYQSVVPREQVAERSVRRLLSDFFGGSPRHLMAHLLKGEDVDEAEMAEIRAMLAAADPGETDAAGTERPGKSAMTTKSNKVSKKKSAS